MVSTRVATAKDIAEKSNGKLNEQKAMSMVFFIEKCGYRVVKPSETLEYHGIPQPGSDEDG